MNKRIPWDVAGLFALLLLFDTAAQLFFKIGVNRQGEFPAESLQVALQYILSLAGNSMVVLGVGTLLLAFFTWLAIIAKIDLSKAHSVTCLVYGTVPLSSAWLLHEPFSRIQFGGVMLIVFGAYIASEHGQTKPSATISNNASG